MAAKDDQKMAAKNGELIRGWLRSFNIGSLLRRVYGRGLQFLGKVTLEAS